jgi:hypothetical protein
MTLRLRRIRLAKRQGSAILDLMTTMIHALETRIGKDEVFH